MVSFLGIAFSLYFRGHGPAWANSLFEDFAEFGLGMTIANEKMQMRLTALMEQALTCDCCSAEIKAQAQKWLDNRNDAVATREVYEIGRASCRERVSSPV